MGLVLHFLKGMFQDQQNVDTGTCLSWQNRVEWKLTAKIFAQLGFTVYNYSHNRAFSFSPYKCFAY